jgi:RHS repeat-associated protein
VRLSYFNNGSSTEVLEENNYYPFGLKHEGYNASTGNLSYQYKYNGKELQTESGMYDYGARFYMPDIGRWGVIDNKAEKYPSMSSYTYAGNNPIAFIDPDGNELILSFATDTARKSYEDLVNASLGGKYSATYSKIEGTNTYKVTLNMVNKDASITKEQQAFYDSYNEVVGADEKVNQKVVERSIYADMGSWQTGDIDIADIVELDKAGKGGTSSAGALIHEHVEQYEKSKMGLGNGELGKTKSDPSVVGGKIYTDYMKSHDKALKAEDKVNGNTRTEAINTSNSNIVNVFKEGDKTKTHQVLWFPKSTGQAEVKKTKLP